MYVIILVCSEICNMCAFDIIQWFVLYTGADTHALPEIDPADKGTPDVTHECDAISRHRYPQFNTRLRLRRVTAVNFRLRSIYCMHVILRVRVLNSREQLNFRTFRHAISTIISEPFSSLFPTHPFHFIFFFMCTYVSFILHAEFVEQHEYPRFISILNTTLCDIECKYVLRTI